MRECSIRGLTQNQRELMISTLLILKNLTKQNTKINIMKLILRKSGFWS